jgi:mannose-6-phosphate isomerase-like protein (cupin superfamily)
MTWISGTSVAPFEFGALTIRDYTAAQPDGSSLAVVTVPPGASHPLAYSNLCEKNYFVLDGEVDFTIGGSTKRVVASDACLIAAGQRFAYANQGSRPAGLLLVHTPRFDPDAEVIVG